DSMPTFVIDPTTPSTLYAGIFKSGVFKSTDGGVSWVAINHGLTNTTVQALVIGAKTPTTLYAGTAGGGAFTSSDGGETWEEMNNGLTNLYVTNLVIDPLSGTTLYAGTSGSGVFDLQIVPLDLSVSVTDSPDPALLSQQIAYQFTVTNHGPATAT